MDSTFMNAILPGIIAQSIRMTTLVSALVVILVHVRPRHRSAAWLIAAPPLIGLLSFFTSAVGNVLLTHYLGVKGYALFLQWAGVWGAIQGAAVTAIYLVGLVRLARAVPAPPSAPVAGP